MHWDSHYVVTRTSPVTGVDFIQGAVLLIDKPLGWTSFDVVNKLRFTLRHGLGIRSIKVGHAGTLDPLATGLLIVCTGKYTKQIDTFQAWDKVYSGVIRLGATTPTYDAESEPDTFFPVDHITPEAVLAAAAQFTGEIWQVPPVYSAIKVKGETSYSLARRGKEVQLKARCITIHSFESQFQSPDITFNVGCSKGTYIRSLAHDVGILLQSGAYLQALRRESIGPWTVVDALTIDEAHEWITAAIRSSQ